MTCIVGVVDKKTKTTYIGGDSLGSNDNFKVVRKDRKVFKLKIAQEDRLYNIGSDYQVGESDDLYDACGCGDVAALSSLHTTEKMNMSPIDRIRLALQSATKINPKVGPPFYIINTKDDKVIKFTN